MPLDLYSEPYGATGNIGQNFRRLLGAPSLDTLQTVIRESVQNTADAAKLGNGPKITIRLRRLTTDQLKYLRSNVLHNTPSTRGSQEKLNSSLGQDDLYVLEICDFETTGLCGPTRSDRIPLDVVRTDFIDFLRNIGTVRDTRQGGGTYGFGKVALYKASKCSTILVDTLAAENPSYVRRFIGCHIGDSFDIPDGTIRRRFTGRHWWGVDPGDGVVDPAQNSDAESIAKSLGMPDRRTGSSGTSIMIVDFDTEGEDPHTIGERIVETLLWNFWPRMMSDVPPDRKFDCYVEVDGTQLVIPDPEKYPPLDLFTEAMTSIRAKSEGIQPINVGRHPREVGTLAIKKGLRSPRKTRVPEGHSTIPTVVNHIALMRPVELVVKYMEGSAFPDERVEWGGVFLCSSDTEIEQAFADSEPPAHDDWNPSNISDRSARTFVNVALRKLRERGLAMGELAEANQPSSAVEGDGLASVSGKLGATLDAIAGEGAGPKRKTGKVKNNRRSRTARATQPTFVRLEVDDQDIVAVFETDVHIPDDDCKYTLQAIPKIAVEGGTLHSGSGLIEPVVREIRSAATTTKSHSGTLSQCEPGVYQIFVVMEPEYAIGLETKVFEENSE